jgi:hypothetical protein
MRSQGSSQERYAEVEPRSGDPERIHREHEPTHHRDRRDNAVPRRRVDLGERDDDQRDADRHGAAERERRPDRREAVHADQADDGYTEERVDPSAEPFGGQWRVI